MRSKKIKFRTDKKIYCYISQSQIFQKKLLNNLKIYFCIKKIKNVNIIFTSPNQDEGNQIIKMIKKFIRNIKCNLCL